MQTHEPLIHHQFRTILVPGHQDKALAEHREIVTCIKQHEAAGAEPAMLGMGMCFCAFPSMLA